MKKKVLHISVLTLFPDFITDYTKFGIIQRALKRKLIDIKAYQLRDFGLDKRGTVDDTPYGGGVGMVLRPDVVYAGIQKLRNKFKTKKTRVILMTPQGQTFKQSTAKRLVKEGHLVLVCGRYEGFDERIRKFVDEEISIGDFILMGGELAALTVTETILRLVPGVLGKLESTDSESFSEALLEYPQYTKPESWIVKKKNKAGKVTVTTLAVPEVLRSGNHAAINAWRKEQAIERTKKRRPDLLKE